METLRIEHVSHQYGMHKALDDITMDVQPGLFGLLGPNGSGKTTLMRLITTLLPVKEGTISYGEVDWHDAQRVRELIGYLPQTFSLYKQARVDEVLEHIAVLKGVGPGRRHDIDELLEKVNLVEHRYKKVGELSGGMVRRLGIAQAVLGEPKIIVVDEPTSGLDPEERVRLRNVLRVIGATATVIISTHIVEDVESLCDQAAVLYRGNVLVHGDIQHIGQAAAGKVCTVRTNAQDIGHYEQAEHMRVLSSQRFGTEYELRVLTQEPPADAQMVTPSLADGYLYLMERAKNEQ